MKSEFEGKQRVPGTPPAADWFTKLQKTPTIEKHSAIKNQKSLEDFENDSNPTNPIENPTIKWKPTLLISVYNSGLIDNQLVKADNTANVIFSTWINNVSICGD